MTDENHENIDSKNDELGEQVKSDFAPNDSDTEDLAAFKEKTSDSVTKLQSANKQLFNRAKKAEGFELQEDGSWVKTIKEDVEKKVEKKPKEKQTDELDFGQLAFYNSKEGSVKLEHAEDLDFLKEQLEETGKDQNSILTSKWFLGELKDRQDARAVKDATPSSERGAAESLNTKPDFWIKKGELPPDLPENRELREQVVNERMRIEENKSKFADQSVVG